VTGKKMEKKKRNLTPEHVCFKGASAVVQLVKLQELVKKLYYFKEYHHDVRLICLLAQIIDDLDIITVS
jgi:hypothetical protein